MGLGVKNRPCSIWPINGINTKVYTKYLTGILDADATSNIDHGLPDVDKIMHVSVLLWDDTILVYRSLDNLCNADVDQSFTLATSSTQVILSVVGNHIQGNKYRIKMEYIL